MSRSDVVRRLRALSSRGVPISVRYLLPVHADLVGQALAIFGSFDRARAVAGIDVPPLDHDPDVVIGALRSLARSGVRLDVSTLETMGEGALVDACVDTFGGLAAAAARAGLAVAPEPRRPSSSSRDQVGFAQPPLSPDGQVSTSLALEVLQKTALQLGKVPAARDLPPDVARRLTTDYGSVRFAYLALRIHAEGEAGRATQSAESAATAAAEPVQVVSQEALAATARMSEAAGAHRRQFDAAREAETAAAPPREEAGEEDDEHDGDFDAAWAEVERAIEAAAAEARARLRQHVGAALQRFVTDTTDLARRQTIVALGPEEDDASPAGDDEEQ